jgi:hypothetical protein
METCGSYQSKHIVRSSRFPDCVNVSHRQLPPFYFRSHCKAVTLVNRTDRPKHACSPECLVDSQPLRFLKSNHPMGTHALSINPIRGFEDMLVGHRPHHVY